MIQIKEIPISKIVGNKGQIPGLPKNPRLIKDEKYKKLVKSLQDDPEMMELRELIVFLYNDLYVTICGNVKYQGHKDLKWKTAFCKILPQDTPLEKLKAYVIKDNISYGENDYDLLANEWEVEELKDWGLDLPVLTELNNTPDTSGNESNQDMEPKICLCPKCGFSWQEE